MKIALLIPHVSGGGGERIFADLSRSLKASEIVVIVFESEFSYPSQGRTISLDLPIDRKSVFGRITGFVRRCYRFQKVLRRERPDVVISFMGEANIINALLSRRPILTVHNHISALAKLQLTGESRVVSLFSKVLVRWLYRRAKVVAVSEAVKRDLVDRFRIPEKQVVVIPNAVNIEHIQKMAEESVSLPWDPALPVAITSGRLCVEKGQWHLVRAFAEVRKRIPCQLAILGAGELEDYLRRLVKQLGIEKDVFFLGWQSNPFRFLARATVFVLPSLTEGFGLVLLEAMACKLPVISTDCPGGSREVVGEHGVLVPALDDNLYNGDEPLTSAELHLANAIASLLKDEGRRRVFAEAGLSRVRDFDPSVFVEKYQRLLTDSAAALPLRIESSME